MATVSKVSPGQLSQQGAAGRGLSSGVALATAGHSLPGAGPEQHGRNPRGTSARISTSLGSPSVYYDSHPCVGCRALTLSFPGW